MNACNKWLRGRVAALRGAQNLAVSRRFLLAIGLTCPIVVLAADETNNTPDTAARQLHTQSLAASCAACHGTNGNNISSDKIARLAGMNPSDFIAKMQAFKSGARPATVMHHHAKGLNAQEITDLAGYFSAQVPHKLATPPSQKLATDDEH